MALNAVQGKIALKETPILLHPGHPLVVVSKKCKPNNGTLKAGVIVVLDSSSQAIAYDRGGSSPANVIHSVLTETVDTTKQTVGRVALHGTVVSKSILHKTTTATVADIKALRAAGIYAV